MLSNQTLSSFFCILWDSHLVSRNNLVTSAKRENILFLFGCSEVNSTWLITSELANQRARKTLFTCAVYINTKYMYVTSLSLLCPTDERSHVIEQSLNRRTGQEERKQDFINLDESEFHVCFISFWYGKKQQFTTFYDNQDHFSKHISQLL